MAGRSSTAMLAGSKSSNCASSTSESTDSSSERLSSESSELFRSLAGGEAATESWSSLARGEAAGLPADLGDSDIVAVEVCVMRVIDCRRLMLELFEVAMTLTTR